MVLQFLYVGKNHLFSLVRFKRSEVVRFKRSGTGLKKQKLCRMRFASSGLLSLCEHFCFTLCTGKP